MLEMVPLYSVCILSHQGWLCFVLTSDAQCLQLSELYCDGTVSVFSLRQSKNPLSVEPILTLMVELKPEEVTTEGLDQDS